MAATSEELQKLKTLVDQLKCQNIKPGAYTRRENIKKFNLKEATGETPKQTENLVRAMLEEQMNISKEDVKEIRFERVHPACRLGKDPQKSNKTRPIITKFSFYQDKDFVWSYEKNLKDTGVGLSHDYPKEIDEIRQKLYPVLKKCKKG